MNAWIERPAHRAAGALLLLLAAYGLISTPGLAARFGLTPVGAVALACWAALVAIGWRWPRLAVILPVALGLRVGVALLVAGRVPSGDAAVYPELARSVLGGEGLRIDDPSVGGTVHAFYPPGYPLLLAAWGAATGLSTAALTVLNAAIDGAAAWALARLGAALERPEVGRRAAWLYLVWPSALLSAPLAQKEGLVALLVLLLALGWVRAGEGRGAVKAAMAIGLPAGLLALTQPGLAPLAGLFGLVVLRRERLGATVKAGLGAAAVAAAAMLPWWVRNWLVLGAFVPLTSAGPISLWVGNNPDATGNWLPLPPSLRGLPELAYARAAGAMAREWIAANPAEFVRLTATKFVRATGVGVFGIARLTYLTPSAAAAAAALFPVAQASHVALLAGAGWSLLKERVPATLRGLVVACLGQMLLFGMWFEFGERHRDFATPFLLLAAGCLFLRREAPRG